MTRKSTLIRAKIPRNKSILAVTSVNTILNGDDFRADGWVYNKGKKKRKWFSKVTDSNARFWEPRLANISALEQQRWVAINRAKAYIAKVWPDIIRQLKEQKNRVNGAMPLGKNRTVGNIVLDLSHGGVSFQWITNQFTESIGIPNQTLIDQYFKFEDRMKQVYGRHRMFDNVFKRAVWERYKDNLYNTSQEPKKLHLVINGRDYWISGNTRRLASNYFEVIAYPEDAKRVVVEDATKENQQQAIDHKDRFKSALP